MRHTKTIPILTGVLLLLLLAAVGCERFWDSESTSERTNSDSTLPRTSAEITTESVVSSGPDRDTTPPVITGEDFEITQGDGISYRKYVTVTDDTDPAPTLEIDNSAVDPDSPGSYPVIYTATDKAGNSSTLTLTLTVKPRIVEGANEAYVLQMASEILDEITDDSMSKLQAAYSIWYWTRGHIAYVDTSDKTSWIVGAYDGFTTRRGDCFTYFSVSKALLTAAGIDNVDVERDRPYESSARHYWMLVNVGDGWYHFDSTVYYAEAKPTLFMLTDEEIKAWDKKYYRAEHNYIADGLPEVSAKSIQDKIDYSSPTLREE